MIDVSIVIVCMNNLKNLYPCLESIRKFTSVSYECFVVAYLFTKENLEKVKAAGYDTSTLVVICNTDDYGDVRGLDNKEVQPGDDVIVITK